MQSLSAIEGKILQGVNLVKDDAVFLLNIDTNSADFYRLLALANALSRKEYANRGYIFVQIGIDNSACSGNCKFCSLAQKYYSAHNMAQKTQADILAEVQKISFVEVEALFLMSTADYPQKSFLDMVEFVRPLLPAHVQLVANVGDFDPAYAQTLHQAGVNGVYHVARLREGTDTEIPLKKRIQTLDAIAQAGLELYYCVEPIGKEHTHEEIADEMLRARDYNVNVMAVMARVGVQGTPLCGSGEISELELTKIAAVARLVTRPKKSMNVHEPKSMSLLAGVNQLYAEIGTNPRDTQQRTENSRGISIAQAKKMLQDGNYIVASQ